MLVLGDAHATTPDRREALLAAYREYGSATTATEGDRDLPEAALHVGDLGHYDLPAPTWFVAGNNEDFDVIDALRGGERPEGVRNAHLLAGAVVEIGGLRVAGLSGNHAPTQYEKSRADLAGDRRRHFVRDDVERVSALEDVDLLLAHEAPTGLVYYGYDAGCEHVTDLLERLRPELCLVGHHHVHREAEVAGVRTVSLAPVWERYYALDPTDLSLSGHPAPVDAEPPE